MPGRRSVSGDWVGAISGYRALGAIVVIFTHFFLQANRYPYKSVVHATSVVVPFFLAISAFVLCRPFIRAQMRGEPAPPAGLFYWRRMLRIWPIYAFILTVYLWLLPGTRPNNGPIEYVALYTFTWIYDPDLVAYKGIPASWYLCDEVVFYLLIPLLALLATRMVAARAAAPDVDRVASAARANLVLAGALVVIGLLARSALTLAEVPGGTSYPVANFEFLGLGLALATASVWEEHGRALPSAVDWVRRNQWCCYLVAVIGLASLELVAAEPGVIFEDPAEIAARYAIHFVVAAFMMTAAFIGPLDAPGNRFLASRPLTWLAIISLDMFLWHQLVLSKLQEHYGGLDQLGIGGLRVSLFLMLYLAILITVALSIVSYYGVSDPLERFKGRTPRQALVHRRAQSIDEAPSSAAW